MSEKLDDVQWEFLVEGLDDYVGLWQWVARVRRRSPDLAAANELEGTILLAADDPAEAEFAACLTRVGS